MTFPPFGRGGAGPLRPAARFPRAAAALAAMLLALGACEGGNAFISTDTTGGGSGNGSGNPSAPADTVRPTISITRPAPDANVAVGDSLFVVAQVADDKRVASVTLEGFVIRGDSLLGTRDTVRRFETKTVDLMARGSVQRDSVLRFLKQTADTTRARGVLIVATARDSAGNTRSTSVTINIGGPRVQIASPAAGDTFRAGSRMAVRIQAEDAVNRIRSFQVRVTGATTQEVNVTLPNSLPTVDTIVQVQLSGTAGAATVEASVTSGSNVISAARPVQVTILPAAGDRTAPLVTFDVRTAARMQATDTVVVPVQGVDDTAVDSVGATLRVRYRDPATGGAVDRLLTTRLAGNSGSLRFPLALLALPATDSVTLAIEVTAWAVDPAQNCGAAVSPNTPQRLPCTTTNGAHLATGVDGRLVLVLVTRGQTMPFPTSGDTIADIASNGRHLFASNINANRVEVLPVAGGGFGPSISVGSRPWGLAISATGDSLFVANSGGTNISVVGVAGNGGFGESRRIRTADVELYDVRYDVEKDSVSSVSVANYSDRPQFLGQLSTGQILYSTRPTALGRQGTIRVYDPAKDQSYEFNRGTEVFTSYADRASGRAIVVNALDAALSIARTVTVCPRRRLPSQPDPACVRGTATQVSAALTALRSSGATDTRLDLGLDVESIGLSDTTFVATSTRRNAVAFGEGAKATGRILYFQLTGGTLVGSSRETGDLLQNASERVIGLGLNDDGSLGVARGNQVYFFDNTLRLAGVVPSGSPTGGSAMHPLNSGYPGNDGKRLGFTSGTDAGGAYIDVIDTHSFRTLRRLPVRDVVTGTMIAVPVVVGDVDAGRYAIRLFAVTRTGVLRIGLTAADLQ